MTVFYVIKYHMIPKIKKTRLFSTTGMNFCGILGERRAFLPEQPSCNDESGPSGGHFLQLGRGSSVSIGDKTWLTEKQRELSAGERKGKGLRIVPQASRSRGQQMQKRLWKP